MASVTGPGSGSIAMAQAIVTSAADMVSTASRKAETIRSGFTSIQTVSFQ